MTDEEKKKFWEKEQKRGTMSRATVKDGYVALTPRQIVIRKANREAWAIERELRRPKWDRVKP